MLHAGPEICNLCAYGYNEGRGVEGRKPPKKRCSAGEGEKVLVGGRGAGGLRSMESWLKRNRAVQMRKKLSLAKKLCQKIPTLALLSVFNKGGSASKKNKWDTGGVGHR